MCIHDELGPSTGMPLPISTLTVTRFRSLRNLTVGPFGKVNLITGRNNTGKSTLLEAIHVLASGGAPSTLVSILKHRQEFPVSETDFPISPDDSPWISNLFSDFPSLLECGDPLTVSSANGDSSLVRMVEIKVGWYSEQISSETGNAYLEPTLGADLFGETYGVPILEIKTPARQRKIRLDSRSALFRPELADPSDRLRIRCVYLDSFSYRSTSQLGAIWDAIALTNAEQQVVNALQIIAPDIEAVSMIGSESGNRSRVVIAKSRRLRAPVSLRTFGDGVNRLFGIILSLIKAAGGVLLVDEIENGLHYSILPDVWKGTSNYL